jgi:hypothetical protein
MLNPVGVELVLGVDHRAARADLQSVRGTAGDIRYGNS